MKLKFKCALAPVYLFSFSVCIVLAVFCSTVSSVDLRSDLTFPKVQRTQNRRGISSGSNGGIQELLDVTTPKEYISSRSSSTQDSHDFEDNDAGLLWQVKSVGRSEWIIDNKTLEIFDNDPQQLIQCTEAGDRVIFKLQGVQKFKRTMVVSHELELISDPLGRRKPEVEYKTITSFTCPDSGPFLIINATNFTTKGLVVENCKEFSGNGTIVIKTGSSAVFENIEISKNTNRAIYVESRSNVVLRNSSFHHDGTRRLYGGVIHVVSNVSLSISNSSFFGNKAVEGGVLFANASNVVVVTTSSFTGNNAVDSGAICAVSNNTLKVESSTISKNIADDCGAVRLDFNNTLNIESSTISRNVARLGGGAMILSYNNNLKIKNSKISKNNAHYDIGGAMWIGDNNILQIENSVISQNNAPDSGGAMHVEFNNTLNVKNSTMSQNNADDGGAIYFDSSNTLNVESSTVSQNNGDNDGGAIHFCSNNTLNVDNSTISQNKGYGGGGAIYVEFNNTLSVRNSTMLQNNAYYNHGGAIYLLSNNSIEIKTSTLSHNKADYGGAIFLDSDNSIEIMNSMISQNKAHYHGGAISLEESNDLTIVNSRLLGNKASESGGALNLASGCHIYMTNSSMTGNNAYWGGCVYLERSVVAIVSSSFFSSNNASRGGVIYGSVECEIAIYSSNFTANHAEFGGCVYGVSSSTKVKTSNFWNNSAFQYGGCFFIESYVAYFEANTFYLNQAKKDGGAIHASSNALLHLKENNVVSNSALNGGGIALTSNSRVLCESGTFRNNKANVGGGGVYIESQMTQVIVAQFGRSTFINNVALQYGGGMVIKTFGSRGYDCAKASDPCSRVLLITTRFSGNIANHSGSAVLATTQNNILVACETPYNFDPTRFVQVHDIGLLQEIEQLKKIKDSSSPCKEWSRNSLASGASRHVIGTFGQTINITTNSVDGVQIRGNSTFGFMLRNVRHTRKFPTLIIKTIDAFGHYPAPNLFERNALTLNSSSKILKDVVAFSFEDGTCNISILSSRVPKGKYTLEIDTKKDDILEPATLTIFILERGINQEFRDGTNSSGDCGDYTHRKGLHSST